MSTDERYVFDPRPVVGDALDHPLLGHERRRTAVAIAFLGLLIGTFAVRYAGATVAIDGVPLEAHTTRFDTLSAALIVLATAAITVVPLLYAAWNGGPALSAVIPLVPVLLGDLAAGQYVLTLDAAIALTVSGAACALALFATDVRRTGSFRPWQGQTTDVDRTALLFVTVVTVVTAVSVARFVAVAPPRYLETYGPFAVCWLVPLGIVGGYWAGQLRTTAATRADRERTES